MKQIIRKNHGTIIVPITKDNVGDSGVIIAKLPEGARIHSVNVTVDEAFDGTTANTITIGVAGTTNKFHNALSIASVAGATSVRQHTAAVGTQEILMSVGGSTATTGKADVTIDFALPTEVSVDY